ncbi:Lhr family helicase [Actinoalloteichus sp. AHMU CJ021]|uniref:Lhr family helicase n=1 Tax=Actinoalloteichus sp. AHMU CJ021 TaxID=2072503 RepID=UPI003FCDA7D4
MLDVFSPATAGWFRAAFATPTSAQREAWTAISRGEHTLVVAPTGSGKTLAAFLWALDTLATSPGTADEGAACRVLYVSPLKALAVDVERNLRTPLAGIGQTARRLGQDPPEIRVGIRTGDTPQAERRAFARRPPDVLVTTPESLFLLLTSQARESLRGVTTVILDEVHALAGSKRGAHLALSLERLDELLPEPAQRIGLSATVRPTEEVAAFLAGGRPVQVVTPGDPKRITVTVEVPVADMTELDGGGPAPAGRSTPEAGEAGPVEGFPGLGDDYPGAGDVRAAGPVRGTSIWPSVERRVLDLVEEHRSTIVFTNSRRLAERLTARLNELAADRAAEAGGPVEPQPTTPVFPAEAVGGSGITGGAPPTVARAHHGSMSKEQRAGVEEDLKAGRLPCVVATSSLELGIDMGAVDLVVQVEAPPSVASGMQRVGRAGHQVGAVSEGVVFPKFRGDLVSCAVVAERMRAGLIEALRYPRNPLDVLAQQVVAMVAMEPWTVEALAGVVRRAAPFSALPDSALHAVLDMLAGRYPSEEFGELRPRIVWDRVHGELRGRPGAGRLAVTSGGTIPDRGLFTVTTPPSEDGSGSRVGELDEEMVYESRVGDTFLLGTSAWRVEDITHDRVIVVPAPGQPARMPFWKGDTPGRPLELGRAIGSFVRELGAAGEVGARRRATEAGLDGWAVDNLLAYLREQREATGHVPDDRTVVVERFRTELGDWQLVVHSPFGGQVNAPWALAIGARLRERYGTDAQIAHSDDGIVLRVVDAVTEDGAEVLPTAEDVLFDPAEIDDVVRTEVSGSALFAARFRECAARSLLLPRRDPRRRTPLWQQRQRAAQLLGVASAYERFPVVLETMRECLRDVYDLPGLTDLLTGVRDRRIRVVEVETPSASPFARSLLFGYVGMFLYETDAPLADRRAAALSLDSGLLAELLGSEAIRELLDPDVLAEVEATLARTAPDRHVRDVEQTADLVRALGDLTEAEAAARGARPEWLRELEEQRRVIRVRLAGEERFAPVEDAGRLRDGLGVALSVGIPTAFTEPVADPVGDLLSRYARTRGPFTALAAATRFGLGVAVVTGVLERLVGTGRLVRGELRPVSLEPPDAGGYGQPTEYCDAEVLRRLRRASLARLRAEVEPVEPAALGRFLPHWHGISSRPGRRPAGAEDVLAVVEQLAGVPVPASAVESLILPARLPGYVPALLDELTASGEVTWCGAGALAGGDGWVALAPTEIADLVLPPVAEEPPDAPAHRALLSALSGGGLFFRQVADRAAEILLAEGEPLPDEATLVSALWDLVWAGLVGNDTLAPVRALVSGGGARHRQRRRAPRGRYASLRAGLAGSSVPARPGLPSRSGPPSVGGRWAPVPVREADPTRRAHARAEVLLERHGVLTRGALDTERMPGGFGGIYRVLRAMEEAGRCRRGYVVEGLGAAQFAVPGAIDRLRSFSRPAGEEPADRSVVVLAATDPAQPHGAALPWPSVVGEGRHRPGRKAGALVVLVDGVATLYLERGGRSLLAFTEDEFPLRAAAGGLAGAVRAGWLDQVTVSRAGGEAPWGTRLADLLGEAGFRATPQGMRLRG